MVVAITGTDGFIGQKLIQLFKKNNIETISINRETFSDISNWNNVKDIKKFDILIHLAAKSFVPDSYISPRNMFNANINGTLNMLELCRKNKARLIFTSSYVYGNPSYLPIDEKHPIKAFNPYAQSKIIGENLCEIYSNNFDISVVVLRLFNVYGKGQSENFLIPSIIKQIKSEKIVLNDLNPKRDYIYIDDLLDVYFKLINKEFSGFKLFNIGSGESVSIKKIISTIELKINKKFDIISLDKIRKNEIKETKADISKISKYINWQPKISFKDGLHKILNK
tara:strand:- start:677 stop:1519 length:843 start_codon:yes stop_codon:yes gene_type:complete